MSADWCIRCLDIWSNIILSVTVRVFLDEINIWICRLIKAYCSLLLESVFICNISDTKLWEFFLTLTNLLTLYLLSVLQFNSILTLSPGASDPINWRASFHRAASTLIPITNPRCPVFLTSWLWIRDSHHPLPKCDNLLEWYEWLKKILTFFGLL